MRAFYIYVTALAFLASASLQAHGDLHPRIHQAEKEAKAHPQDAQAQLNLAELLLQHNELGQALGAFERAAQLKAPGPAAWLGLAYCANRQGQAGQAESAAREALKLSASAKAYYELGMALQSQAQLSPATAAYGRAFELDPEPDKALAWLRTGVSALPWAETRGHVQAARQRLGDLASLLEASVSLARSKKELKDALAWQNARLKAEGEQAALLETLGDIHQELGQSGKARAAWGRALEAWKLLPESRRKTPALMGLPERVKVKGGRS